MTILQAIVMAVLQGVTELFRGQQSRHAVILPRLLKWGIDQKAADFLPYLVVMHLGTAVALLLYFWRDWWAFAVSLLSQSGEARSADRRNLPLRRIGDHSGGPGRRGSSQIARRRLRDAGRRRDISLW